MSKTTKFYLGCCLFTLSTGALGGPVNVDGVLSDWGVTPKDTSSSSSYCGSDPAKCIASSYSFLPVGGKTYGSTTQTPKLVDYVIGDDPYVAAVEDTNDKSDSYDVGPNSGGQNYDVEFLGLQLDGTVLSIAAMSGQRPDNGFEKFAPGDFYITINGVVYGLEVGGGAGGASNPATITEGANGSTYSLNSDGSTNTHTSSSKLKVGSLYLNPSWVLDPIDPKGPTQVNASGTLNSVLVADFAFAFVGTQHSVLETQFDLAGLVNVSKDSVITVAWGPSCGNDRLEASLTMSGVVPPLEVPEPALTSLVGLGLLGLGIARRRRTE